MILINRKLWQKSKETFILKMSSLVTILIRLLFTISQQKQRLDKKLQLLALLVRVKQPSSIFLWSSMILTVVASPLMALIPKKWNALKFTMLSLWCYRTHGFLKGLLKKTWSIIRKISRTKQLLKLQKRLVSTTLSWPYQTVMIRFWMTQSVFLLVKSSSWLLQGLCSKMRHSLS